jgi:hypothetical protein
VLRVSEQRAICADCGHTGAWHDREAARAMRSGELASDRRCYREIGGAGCRCGGFRDSGEVAVVSGRPRQSGIFMTGVLTLLLVVMGLALLYAYRSQTPSVQVIPFSQAISLVNAGQVVKVTVVAERATLELRNGERQQTLLPNNDQVFQKALTDYNAANPARTIAIEYTSESQTFSVIGSTFLSLLPVLLIGGFFYYMMRRSMYR